MNMVNVGIIGIGFMGVTHYKAIQQIEGARVAAICTRNKEKLGGDWRSIQGNFGDSGGIQDVSQLSRYEDWRELLGDETIDLVDICLPTHLHREVTIAALQAGKHVLVEKPLALNLEDADAMIAAANEAERMLMVGQVLRFFPAFAEARALVQSGDYGKLLAAHLKRIIALPKWSSEDHFSDAGKSGGASLDLHIHDTDYVHFLAGVPDAVRATGVTEANGAINYLQTQYHYAGEAPCISCQSGAIAMPGLSFEHGFDIYLEKATLRYNNLGTGDDIWLYPAEGEKQILRPQRPDAFVAQLSHAVGCVASGQESELISARFARQALAVCLKEQEAVRSGDVVKV
jgi:predicted dehydrogenase